MSAVAESVRSLTPAKLALIGGVAVVLIGFFTFLALNGGSKNQDYTPVYTNLTTDDSAEIVEYLDQNAIPYEVRANGTQIHVPREQMLQLRLRMAGEGIPSGGSGVGYEVFDESETLGTSNFVHNVNYIRALEGELSRTISSMRNVKTARVHLVVPKRELFTREKKPPTASVALQLTGAKKLSREEITSIQHLVSTAVPGLELNRITIVDNQGRLLARGGGDDDLESLVGEANEYRVNYEKRLKEKLETIIGNTVGLDNVRVSVSADIDFDRIVRKSETYDPESQVARSVQAIEEIENTVERDTNTNVSVANNLPDPAPGGAGVVSESNISKTDETTNFEISKVVENHVQEIGTVNRLSVGVLINGTYQFNEEGDPVYTPRSQEELEQISRLVKSGIGFDEVRGDTVEVVNLPFADSNLLPPEDQLGWLKDDFNNIMQTAILGIVAILAILLVIRPLVSRAIDTTLVSEEEDDIDSLMAPDIAGQITDQSGGDSDILDGLEDDDMLINIENVRGGIKSSSVRRITDLIDKHPEEALSALRSWMMVED